MKRPWTTLTRLMVLTGLIVGCKSGHQGAGPRFPSAYEELEFGQTEEEVASLYPQFAAQSFQDPDAGLEAEFSAANSLNCAKTDSYGECLGYRDVVLTRLTVTLPASTNVEALRDQWGEPTVETYTTRQGPTTAYYWLNEDAGFQTELRVHADQSSPWSASLMPYISMNDYLDVTTCGDLLGKSPRELRAEWGDAFGQGELGMSISLPPVARSSHRHDVSLYLDEASRTESCETWFQVTEGDTIAERIGEALAERYGEPVVTTDDNGLVQAVYSESPVVQTAQFGYGGNSTLTDFRLMVYREDDVKP